jgi:hypothetical protein
MSRERKKAGAAGLHDKLQTLRSITHSNAVTRTAGSVSFLLYGAPCHAFNFFTNLYTHTQSSAMVTGERDLYNPGRVRVHQEAEAEGR